MLSSVGNILLCFKCSIVDIVDEMRCSCGDEGVDLFAFNPLFSIELSSLGGNGGSGLLLISLLGDCIWKQAFNGGGIWVNGGVDVFL